MSNCSHQKVCRHYSSNEILECSCQDICKHFEISSERPACGLSVAVGGARHNRLKKALHEDEGPSLEDFKKAKVTIARLEKLMTDNQRSAYEATMGIHFTTLTVEQRKQVVEIAADLVDKNK
jgi:hypothetical protein